MKTLLNKRIKLRSGIAPGLRKGKKGTVTKILKSGGCEIAFDNYTQGYGKTLGSKGCHVRVLASLVVLLDEIKIFGITISF